MRWSVADLRGTVAVLEEWWTLLAAGVPQPVAASRRPAELQPLVAAASPPGSAPPSVDQVEQVVAALSRSGRELARLGYVAKPQTGTVAGVFTSDGGVPKASVGAAEVTTSGLSGDRQRTRRYHGRVWQALCLWSAEVVADLQAEGHPVFPGACGENVSLAGLDWGELRSGARLLVGTALVELSLPTDPCRQILPFFTDGQIRRVDHYRHPGSARWYATVLESGRLAVGDAVEVEPHS